MAITQLLLITNVVVGILVVADIILGVTMGKRMRKEVNFVRQESDMDFCELHIGLEDLEKRVDKLDKDVTGLQSKPKKTPKKKSTVKK
jgi:peptidoglycan hydrolase CwlO-like protein